MSQAQLPEGAVLIDDGMPTGKAPESALPEGSEMLPEEPVIPTAPPPTQPEEETPPNFVERLGQAVGERIENVERGSELYSAGEINYPEFALYGFANAFGALADVVGESAFTVLSTLTPDQAEEFLKEQIVAGGTKLVETDAAKAALEFYYQLSPAQKDLLVNSLETAISVVPGGQWGKGLINKAVTKDKADLTNIVLDNSTAAKQKRAAESGLPKNIQYTLNNEDEILNTILSLGITGSTKPGEIVARVNREVRRLGDEIDKSLRKSQIRVSPNQISQVVQNRLDEFVIKNPIYESGNLANQIKRANEALEAALKQYDGTPRGLLELRRKFDNNINTIFAKDVHAGDSSSREIALQMRNALNELTQSTAPNDNIRSLMRRQHLALLAKENTSRHIATQTQKNLAEKAINLAERHPFAAASIAQGGGMLTNIPEGVGLTAAGALGAYGLTRAPSLRAIGTTASTLPLGRGLLYGAINDFQNQTEETQ